MSMSPSCLVVELECGGHFSSKRTARKILDSELFWKTLFANLYSYCKSCDWVTI